MKVPHVLIALTLMIALLPASQAQAELPIASDVAAESQKTAPTRLTESWQVELEDAPVGIPVALVTNEGRFVIVVPLENSIEIRRADDGALIWRRSGLIGAGLARDDGATARLGWAGLRDGTNPTLIVIDASRKTDPVAASYSLGGRPIGPPLPVRQEGDSVSWYVPLENGRVALVDELTGAQRVFALEDPIDPPLIEIFGRAFAVSGPRSRLRQVESPDSGRRLPRGISAGTVTVDKGWVFGAGERGVCAWRCRERRNGRISCHHRWCQRTGARVSAPPVIVGRRVMVGSWDTFLYLFDRRTGHLVWRVQEGQRIATAPLIWNEAAIVVPLATPRVSGYSMTTGRQIANLAGEPQTSFPSGGTLAGDQLVVPVLREPRNAVLRAWKLTVPEPEEAASESVEDDAGPETEEPRGAL